MKPGRIVPTPLAMLLGAASSHALDPRKALTQYGLDAFQEGLVEVGPGVERLEVRYAGLSFLAPERLRFRYTLQGFDRHWTEAGGRREAFHTNVPTGAYRFRVSAGALGGPWNEAGAALDLRLRPRFTQTPAFSAIVAAAAAFLAFTAHRIRVRGMRRREAELLSLVEARTRDLQAQKEAAEQAKALAQAIDAEYEQAREALENEQRRLSSS